LAVEIGTGSFLVRLVTIDAQGKREVFDTILTNLLPQRDWRYRKGDVYKTATDDVEFDLGTKEITVVVR